MCIRIQERREQEGETDRERLRFILRNRLTRLWRLTSPESAGQADRLETKRSLFYSSILKAVWRQNPFFLGRSPSFPL